LHDIFCIVFVPHQPARQPIPGIEMREDDRVKPLSNSKRPGPSINSVCHGASVLSE
jgi:hypothetical protein